MQRNSTRWQSLVLTCLAAACSSEEGSVDSSSGSTAGQVTSAQSSTGQGLAAQSATSAGTDAGPTATTLAGTTTSSPQTTAASGGTSGQPATASTSAGGATTNGSSATSSTSSANDTSSTSAAASTGGGTTSVSATTGTTGSTTGGYDSHCTREETERAKAVVQNGITAVFIEGNGAVIDDYWADPYIQHNPIAMSGVETFKSFFSNVSPGFYALSRLIGECDKVLIHGSYQGSGATFDMLRVDLEIDRMVEHWDAAVSGSPGANPFLDGPSEVQQVELTGPNRELVIGFVNDVMIGGNTQNAADYLAPDLVEHAAGGMNGVAAFVQRIADESITYSTIHHQIADGNFVFTLSEGEANATAYGFYDLFLVEENLIVRHWGTRLQVQDGASGEGIF